MCVIARLMRLRRFSEVNELDFEQPRALWSKVFDDGARERLVQNLAGHLSGAKSAEVKARQRESFFFVRDALHPPLTAS
jgi:catalase